MSKKVIVLADNSYTIRRIVELSFSEIENIEIRSFENGSGIKEKLLQLAPAVVIVDVKLPEFNGYDVCRFVNETPLLNKCRVFLMKGSFEPVDNEMLKNLKYEDIITKPFDSNALVGVVMKIVNQDEPAPAAGFAGEGPTTFPEDFPEIETDMPESEDISFSDIRGEMDAPPSFERPAAGPLLERDEILPSEEITQGTQPLKDNLMPQESEETIHNPFEEEPAFEEINMAPSAAATAIPLEYEKDPPAATPAAAAHRDVSDEFHERFLEIANEDTSEDLLKSSLVNSPLAEADDLQFPVELKDEVPGGEEKLALEFEQTDMGSPAKTLYAGPGRDALFGAGLKAPAARGLEMPVDKVPEKERGAEKARPEARSPQDELARLSDMTKRESKPEHPPAAGVAAADAQRFELTGKLEDKLNQTIKELLWEIVPPLAEKIIKEEIDKIKTELNDSGL
jgi:DNA-binding response OmpR family regulator